MSKYYRLSLVLVLIMTGASLVRSQTSRSAGPNLSTRPALPSASAGASDKRKSEAATSAATDNAAITDPLIRMLVAKGLLTMEDARALNVPGTTLEQRDRLAALLRDKGLISAAEFEAVRNVVLDSSSSASVATGPVRQPSSGDKTQGTTPQKPAAPTKIAAVAPVRLLGIDTPKREGLVPDIKLGTGARLKLYGIFKTSIIHDSSSPQGNDFPLPLLAADTGPNNSPEFHLRARGLRLGANFEWLDPAPKMVITGKIEFDFEGNFTRANNRNISSIRSAFDSLGVGAH